MKNLYEHGKDPLSWTSSKCMKMFQNPRQKRQHATLLYAFKNSLILENSMCMEKFCGHGKILSSQNGPKGWKFLKALSMIMGKLHKR